MDGLDGYKGILKIILSINGNRVKGTNDSNPNSNILYLKDIQKDKFINLNLNIVNNVKMDFVLKLRGGNAPKTTIVPKVINKPINNELEKERRELEEALKMNKNDIFKMAQEEAKKVDYGRSKLEEEAKKNEEERIRKEQEEKRRIQEERIRKEQEEQRRIQAEKYRKEQERIQAEKMRKEQEEKKKKEQERLRKLHEDRIRKENEIKKREEEEQKMKNLQNDYNQNVYVTNNNYTYQNYGPQVGQEYQQNEYENPEDMAPNPLEYEQNMGQAGEGQGDNMVQEIAEEELIEDLTQMKPVEQKKQRSLGNNSKDWRPQLKPVPNTVSNMDKVSQFEPKNKKPPISNKRPTASKEELDSEKPEEMKEVFPESMTYDKYMNDLKQKNIKEDIREAFCEGFFIASFPMKDGKVIEKSEKDVKSLCGHEECSKVPAMKPEIIMRYPLKDTKSLELNNLAATICFPTGIKLCFSEDEEPKQMENYVTQITNQKGERYYMRTFHFYEKMQYQKFSKIYSDHPLKHLLMTFGDEYTVLSAEDLDKYVPVIEANLEFAQQLGFRDVVYIPFCICLISKYSYITELEVCLSTIYKIISQHNLKKSLLLNDLIMYLIHSVPIPEPNAKVRFFIPYNNTKLELLCPKVSDDSIMYSNFTKLFDYLSIDSIILIFRLLLSEKKILFIDDDYTELTNVINSFTTLLYPFEWVHTYIPIMSDQMLKYLETFLPFINGIHISLMNKVENICKEGDIEESGEVFLIYIKKDDIRLCSSFKGDKKTKLQKYVQANVLPLPFEKDLKKELKSIESRVKSLKKDEKGQKERLLLENRMRDVFVDIFVKMFHDYEKFIGVLQDDVIFNKVLFMKTINKDEKFYDEFIDCQLFQQFTQNLTKDEFSYFKKKIKEYNEKDKKLKKTDKDKNIEKAPDTLYIIKPNYLGIQANDKEVIAKTIDQNYKYQPKEEVENGIIENFEYIVPENYKTSNCLVYVTPENKKAIKEYKNPKDKKGTSQKSLSGGDQMTDKQADIIKEEVKDIVVKIFKSQIDEKDIKNKKNIIQKLDSSLGRSFFVSLISNNLNNEVILQDASFNYLSSLISSLLVSILKLAETDMIIEESVILIKSTKFFILEIPQKKGAAKTMTMYEDRINYFIEFNKVDQENFWEKWFDIDIRRLKQSGVEINDNIKEQQILKLCNDIMSMKITKTFVKKVCENACKKCFTENSDKFKKCTEVYLESLKKAKYISKAEKHGSVEQKG